MVVTLLVTSSTIDSQAITARKLSQVSELQAENLKLKMQLLATNCSNSQISLNAERTKLEGQFRDEIKPNEKDTFDWNSLSFIPSNSVSK